MDWEEALHVVSENLKAAGNKALTLVSGKLSLEDQFAAKSLAQNLEGKIVLYSHMGGGEWVSRVGLSAGSDLGKLEKGTTIVVFASDLHEEAPLWWLRVKAAAERGANLITVCARKTRLDQYATHTLSYGYGDEEKALRELFEGNSAITKSVTKAET